VTTLSDEPLHLADAETWRDLGTYLRRAKRLDPDGAARLVGHGHVLAVYVSPLHDGGLPVVLGLRTLALAAASDVDVTVDLAALADRLARPVDEPLLPVPPAEAAGVTWAGISPPRSGWTPVGHLRSDALRRAAQQGVAEVAAGVPDVAGGPVVARLRASVWGRPLEGLPPGAEVPAGASLAADGLGFLDDDGADVLAVGPWRRLTCGHGHVLVRRPAIL
jgi:hypothetical protein